MLRLRNCQYADSRQAKGKEQCYPPHVSLDVSHIASFSPLLRAWSVPIWRHAPNRQNARTKGMVWPDVIRHQDTCCWGERTYHLPIIFLSSLSQVTFQNG